MFAGAKAVEAAGAHRLDARDVRAARGGRAAERALERGGERVRRNGGRAQQQGGIDAVHVHAGALAARRGAKDAQARRARDVRVVEAGVGRRERVVDVRHLHAERRRHRRARRRRRHCCIELCCMCVINYAAHTK